MKAWSFFDRLVFGLMRWLAEKSTDFFITLKITQNQVTFFGCLVFLPLTAFAFAQGEYRWSLLGLVFAFLHSYLDFADGALGRKTNTLNKLGAFSDPAFDLIGSGLIMAGIAFGVLRNFFNHFWLAVVVLALFGHYAILVITYIYQQKVYGKNGDKFLSLYKKSKTNFFDYLIKEFIFLRSFLFLFFGTLRYSLIIFTLLNKLPYFLLIYAIFSNLRWMVLFFAYAEALNEPGTKIPQVNLRVIKILRHFLLSKDS